MTPAQRSRTANYEVRNFRFLQKLNSTTFTIQQHRYQCVSSVHCNYSMLPQEIFKRGENCAGTPLALSSHHPDHQYITIHVSTTQYNSPTRNNTILNNSVQCPQHHLYLPLTSPVGALLTYYDRSSLGSSFHCGVFERSSSLLAIYGKGTFLLYPSLLHSLRCLFLHPLLLFFFSLV